MTKRRPRPVHGLYPSNFPKPVRWKLDYDYADTLPAEAQEWLADFSDVYYGADLRSDLGQSLDTEERREIYRAKNSVNRDAYEIADVTGLVTRIPDLPRFEVEDPAAADRDVTQAPDYLASDEYRAAVAAFRKALPARGVGQAGCEDPEYVAAKAQLERIRRNGEVFEEAPRAEWHDADLELWDTPRKKRRDRN